MQLWNRTKLSSITFRAMGQEVVANSFPHKSKRMSSIQWLCLVKTPPFFVNRPTENSGSTEQHRPNPPAPLILPLSM